MQNFNRNEQVSNVVAALRQFARRRAHLSAVLPLLLVACSGSVSDPVKSATGGRGAEEGGQNGDSTGNGTAGDNETGNGGKGGGGAAPATSSGGTGGKTVPGIPVDAKDRVTVPIEVFGKDGTVKQITVAANGATVGAARQLWLKVHNVRYATKASVQVNGSPWVQLSNNTVRIEGPGKAFGGIGGGFAVLSLSFDLPAGTVVAGANTIRFRFDKTNGLSMGYRVLGVDFLDGSGAHLLPSAMFVEDDPGLWKAPNGSSATNGKTLWQTVSLTEGPSSTTKLKARCSDCHAEDGRDLKYFGYTNLSIVERSKFHGLTDVQGNDIAAYIRAAGVGIHGRPWNPPFQPGVGLTSRPVEAFSAGAGVDSVVDEDATLAAVFAKGFDRSSLAEGNALRRFPLSDFPVGLQLPDWNHWLPEIHPKDAIGDAFESNMANVRFKALRDRLTEKSKSPTALAEYLKNTGNAPFLFPGGGARNDFNGWRDGLWDLRVTVLGLSEEQEATTPWTDLVAREVYATAVWGQVKTWELMNKYGLEDYAAKVYPMGESRSWFSERHLFDTSPFLQGIRGGPKCPLEPCNGALASDERWSGSTIGNTQLNYDYLSNSWYHLQLSLNGGQRNCGGHQCTDYGYAYGFLYGLFDATGGFYEGGRRLLWGIKAMEERDTNLGPALYNGFSFATSNPLRPIGLGQTGVVAWWGDTKKPNRHKALQATVQVWAEKIGTWSVEQWRTANYGQTEDGANFMDANRVVGDGSNETQSRSLGDGLFGSLSELKSVKIHPAVVNALARFGLAMWPKNAWMAEGVAPSGTAPAVPTLRSAPGGVTVTWSAVSGATSYNVHRASSAQGPWLTVALLRTSATLTDVPPATGKTYHYVISANGAATESALSSAASVSF